MLFGPTTYRLDIVALVRDGAALRREALGVLPCLGLAGQSGVFL